MARRHGRKGNLYTQIAAAGPLLRVASITKWSVEFSTDKEEVSAMGDQNKSYVAGLPDASGEMEGKWDDAGTWSLYAAAADGTARAFILYPLGGDNTAIKVSGDAFFDYSVEGSVDGAIEFSSEWMAAGPITNAGL